ncbi:hypothetical protein [Actinomadura sp. 9N407]|uniref:hypothetical protein n=1 Tax=Actinomadura sp. 9N407 TaxID=3375154 RepID=UPI0037935846
MGKGRGPGDLPAFPDLIRELREAVALFDALRRVQMDYEVPDELYELCRAIVDHRDQTGEPTPGGPTPKGTRSPRGRRVVEQRALRHAPLRQMVFEVIRPGEEFTVSDVTRGLADLGIAAEANAVSNALGYWVTRERLRRVRKGVYQSLAASQGETTSGVPLKESSGEERVPGRGGTLSPGGPGGDRKAG